MPPKPSKPPSSLESAFLDAVASPVVILDPSGKILLINQACQQFTQYAPQEVLGRDFCDVFFLPQERETILQGLVLLARGEALPEFENTWRTRGGESRLVSWNQTALRDSRGKVKFILVTGTDITGLRAAVDHLRLAYDDMEQRMRERTASLLQSEETLRTLLDAIPESAFLMTPEGFVLEANQTVAARLGVKAGELIGNNVYEFVPAEVAEYRKKFVAEVLNTRRPLKFEDVRQDRQVQNTVYPVFNQRGDVICMAMLGVDVTERKRAEAALAHKASQLSALYETSLEINARTELSTLLKAIMQRATRLLGIPSGAIYLLRPDLHQLELVTLHGIPEKYMHIHLAVGEGLAGRVLEQGSSLVVEDYSHWEHRSKAFEGDDFRRSLCLPLRVGQAIIGCILLTDMKHAGGFSQEEILLAQMFADQAAIAIQNARLYEETRLHEHRLQILNEITRIANSRAGSTGILNELAENFYRLLDADGAGIALWDETTHSVRLDTWYGGDQNQPPLCQEIATAVLRGSQTLTLYETQSILPFQAVMGLPLEADGRRLGAALIARSRPQRFGPEEIHLGEQAAGQVSLAITKERLLQAERQRSAELARSRDLLTSLSDLAAELQGVHNYEGVLEIAGAGLRRQQVSLQVALLENDPAGGGNRQMVVRYTSIDATARLLLEKMTGSRLIGFVLPEDTWRSNELLNSQRPYIRSNPMSLLQMMFPAIPVSSLELALKTANVVDTPSLYIPLVAHGQTLGNMALWGKELSGDDIQAYSIFANQVAIALDNARLYGEIQQLAILDELTGLYNRRGFFALAEQHLLLSRRSSQPALLIFLDVDGLKRVNDTHGHQEGDVLLQDAARALRQTFRVSDILARMGGDEFAVLVIQSDQKAGSTLLARLSQNVQAINESKGRKIPLSFSVGVSFWDPQQPVTLDELLARSDAVMYEQKRRKKESLEPGMAAH